MTKPWLTGDAPFSLHSYALYGGDGGDGGGDSGNSGRGGGRGDTGIGGPGDAGGPGRGSGDAAGGYGGYGSDAAASGGASTGYASTPATAPTPTSRPSTVAPVSRPAVVSRPTVAPKTTVPTVAQTPKAPVVSHLATANVTPTTTTLSPVAQNPTTLSPVNSTTATLSPVASIAQALSPVNSTTATMAPTSVADAYGLAASTMGQAGIGSVGGRQAAGAPGGKQGPNDAGAGRGASIGGPAAGTGPTGTGAGRGSSPGGPGLGGAEASSGPSGGRGPSSSSPAGGSQAAGGFADGSRGGMGPDFGGSSPAEGAQAAGGYNDGSRGLAGMMGEPSARSAQEVGMTPTQRSAEDTSMATFADQAKDVISVIGAGRGYTTVGLLDGTQETRSGPRGSRNNNPGNVEYGPYAKSKGAVGTDGRFAVFANEEQGKKAMQDLAFGPTYSHLSIDEAISKYAPPSENNSKSYATAVAAAAGVPTSTTISSLNDTQKAAMIDAMIGVEGSKKSYSVETHKAGVDVSAYATEPAGRSATTATSGFQTTPVDNAPTPTANPNSTPANDDSYEAPGEAAVFGKDDAPPGVDPTTTNSIGRQIAAGVIDAVIGTAGPIGLMNAGMGLAGVGTFGQNVVDGFMSGQTPAVDNAQANYGGGGTVDDRVQAGAPSDVVNPQAPEPDPTFVERYLVPKRDFQTPGQKWGRPAA